MFLFDLFKNKSTFFCIFCQKHKRNTHAEFITANIGVCKECSGKLRCFPLAPLPIETHSCKTVVSVFPYNDILRMAIHNYKFNDNPGYSKVFSHYVITYIEQFNTLYKNTFTDMFDFIVPVPLSKQRLRERGYNQSTLIAKDFSERFNIPLNCNALLKIRHTKQQSLVPHNLRQKNVAGAYRADKNIVFGKRILLFDDIFTTGSTVESCAKTLIEAGALNVSVITLANRPYFLHSKEYYDLLNMV